MFTRSDMPHVDQLHVIGLFLWRQMSVYHKRIRSVTRCYLWIYYSFSCCSHASTHLREQWRHHNHLILSSIILIVLATPRQIISFLSGCMKSPRQPGLFLLGYFVSFISPLLAFAIYVLPSPTYKKEFDTVARQPNPNLATRIDCSRISEREEKLRKCSTENDVH